ncbi:DUF2851 family protein [Niabella aquatica]
MNEHLLQFIWQFQYFNKSALASVLGEPVEVIAPGTLNTNQGPDFINAKIRISNTLWVGSVEMHLKTSYWLKHGHTGDDNYTNVILHVVYENDVEESPVPVLELRDRIARSLLYRYNELMLSKQFIACEKLICNVPELTINIWKDRLIAERLQRKTLLIQKYLEQNKQHWEESFWWLLARTFGTTINAEAFEALARSISLNILAKHKNQQIQLEALLLGQAGMLAGTASDDKYVLLLQREYRFLQAKYNLVPIVFPVHFFRMRPGNFPTVRLAQLAALVFNSAHLFSKITEEPDLGKVKKWLAATPNDFWSCHYTLNDESCFKEKPVGTGMINNIVINTIVPVLFVYGCRHHLQEMKNKALQWLEETRAEQNTITKSFKTLGIQNKTAYDSQALVELKLQYCEYKKCLHCAIGNAVIKG